jgi:enterochelin esterase family protein
MRVLMGRALLGAATTLLVLLMMTPPARAESASVTRLEETMPSAALHRPLPYALYLPPGYAEGTDRLPVIYLLHGAGGVGRHWLTEGYARETADKLIAEHRIAPMILVMPDAENSWYVDSADVNGPGDYATAISRDLVAWIDGHYRTRAERSGRGIAGISMGGFGAFRLAFLHPEEYAAAASLSGAFWARVTPDMPVTERTDRLFNGAFGAHFSVDRFLRDAPLTLADRLKGRADPPALYLTVGNQDRYNLSADAVRLHDKLAAMGLPVRMDTADGDHDWDFWMRAIPGLLDFMNGAFRGSARQAGVRP